MMIESASFDAAISHGEALAREGVTAPGRKGAACRVGLTVMRPMFSALRNELERGTELQDILRGFEPIVANIASTIVGNSTLSTNEVMDVLCAFAEAIANEALVRVQAARGERAEIPDMVRTVELVDGGHA